QEDLLLFYIIVGMILKLRCKDGGIFGLVEDNLIQRIIFPGAAHFTISQSHGGIDSCLVLG
ncbi:MAG TPA: hypothetical protein VI756_06020, partial [Blastocatellia bacterium]